MEIDFPALEKLIRDDAAYNHYTCAQLSDNTFKELIEFSSLISVPSSSVSRLQEPGLPFPNMPSTDDSATVQKKSILKRPRKGKLAQQAVELTPETLAALRGLPLPLAAGAVGVCATAFKRACRNLGVVRWDYKRGPGRGRRNGHNAAAAPLGTPAQGSERPSIHAHTVEPAAGKGRDNAGPAAMPPVPGLEQLSDPANACDLAPEAAVASQQDSRSTSQPRPDGLRLAGPADHSSGSGQGSLGWDAEADDALVLAMLAWPWPPA